MLTVFFAPQAPQNFEEVSACDHEQFARFHRGMLDRGIYLPPSGYEAWFVSAAHGDEEVDATLAAARDVLAA